jgi:hypothetical protein
MIYDEHTVSFSSLVDEGITKIWKKLNSHGGFLTKAVQKCAARWAELALLFSR